MSNLRLQPGEIWDKISSIAGLPLSKLTYTFLDTETTGLSPKFGDRICEIALVCCVGTTIVESFSTLINPGRSISRAASAINGITDEMVAEAPAFANISKDIRRLLDGTILVAHNAQFDLNFLSSQFRTIGQPLGENIVLDTLLLSRKCYHFPSNSLGRIAMSLGVPTPTLHRALGDTMITKEIFSCILSELAAQGIDTIEKILVFQGGSVPFPKAEEMVVPPLLEEAIDSKCLIKLKYLSAHGRETTRIVEPIEVTSFNDCLYLMAHCYLRGDQRTFRLDRVLSMELMSR